MEEDDHAALIREREEVLRLRAVGIAAAAARREADPHEARVERAFGLGNPRLAAHEVDPCESGEAVGMLRDQVGEEVMLLPRVAEFVRLLSDV